MVGVPGTAAHAATVTVPNGITTTDLAAVGMSPALLAGDLAGAGVTVTNVKYTGANAQAGRVHAVDPAVVSFNDGVILSSGNIADVTGPNKSDGITGDMAGAPDADLNALIANTQTVYPVTFDAASLEFDFVPTASQVYFTYTFGSDEYLEWVNLFNDVFAFYVNGSNCATVPSGAPVSIDTINSAVNPNLFRDNSYSSPPANPINIESDGLSVEMVCSASVNPGQVNHMKLAIADTSDQILDSVVMLKANSLSTVKPEACNDGVDNDDDTLVDMNDDSCKTTTTAPPTGSSGIGTAGKTPPFTGNEGTPINLDAASLGWKPSADTVSTSWTVTGINGTPGTCTVEPAGKTPLVGGAIAPVTAICPNEGEYVARVDGWDVENKGSFDYDVDFFVHNAPPAVAIDTPAQGGSLRVGEQLDLTATVTEPGTADTVTCTINWGDGTDGAGVYNAGACTGSHAYTTTGQKIVSVTATDNAGDSSAAATSVMVIDAATVPAAPAAPAATPASGAATVAWVAPGDGGAVIDHYAVEVAPAGGNFAPATGCTNLAAVLKCKATGLTNGTGYTFRVRAHNANGWGEFSAPSATVTPALKPGAPVNPVAAAGTASGTMAASWGAPANDGGSPIDSYAARAYLDGSTTAVRSCTAPTPAGCTITGLAMGSYSIKVQAHNALGWGPLSAASNSQSVTTKPGAPVNPVAAAGAPAALVASWGAPASDGGVTVDSYTVRAYLDGATAAAKSCTAATIDGCTLTGLVGGSYTVKVQAHNALGWGPLSAASAAAVVVGKPGAPTNPVATPTGTAGALSATWTAPVSDGGAQIDNYLARAYLNGTTASKYCYATTPAGCTITGLPAGSYTVKVTAHNVHGWGTVSAASPLTPVS